MAAAQNKQTASLHCAHDMRMAARSHRSYNVGVWCVTAWGGSEDFLQSG